MKKRMQLNFMAIAMISMIAVLLLTTVVFYKIAKPAGLLPVPYLLWVAFAGYLNLGIYLLN